jgi:hypothetical protein
LSAQELEISHELSNAFQELDRWYATAQTNLNRRQAAEVRVRAFQAEFDAGRPEATLDLVLRAQSSLAQSEVAYYRSLIEYSKAIANIHYRKGTLLEHNNVHLSEGLWDAEAYDDALRSAWARSTAFDTEKLHTEPHVIESGAVIGSAGVILPDDHPLMTNPGNDILPDNQGENPVPAPTAAPAAGDDSAADDNSVSLRAIPRGRTSPSKSPGTSFGSSAFVPRATGPASSVAKRDRDVRPLRFRNSTATSAIRPISYEQEVPRKSARMRTNGGTRTVSPQTLPVRTLPDFPRP